MREQAEEHVALQHEMLMRGFNDVIREKGHRREYAEAYDAFLDEHSLNGRIGELPDNIQETFKELLEREPVNEREGD